MNVDGELERGRPNSREALQIRAAGAAESRFKVAADRAGVPIRGRVAARRAE